MDENGQPRQVQPFVTVIAGDQALIGPNNPNGIKVVTNMIPGKADNILIMLLADGIKQMVLSIQSRKVSSNIVLPTGEPAPLPENN